MEENKPKVSIIIPLYNKEHYLKETLSSILNQSYNHLEILIIDDYSTDASLQIVKELVQQDKRIKLIENTENKGGNFSRNRGIDNASGEWLIFFDADDLMAVNCIEDRIKQVSSSIDGLISSMGTFNYKIGDNPGTNWIPKENNYLERFLSHKLPWTIMQPIWRTSFIRQHGGFNEAYSRLQDVDFHTKLLVNKARIQISNIKIPDCYYRVVEGRHASSKLDFLKKWVDSAKLYYNNYASLNTTNSKNLLNGTLIETISQILYFYQLGTLKKNESKSLSNSLLALNISNLSKAWLKLYFTIQLNSPVHIRGLKKVIRIILKCP